VRRRLLRVAGVAVLTTACLLCASGRPARSSSSVAAGDPARGAAVWVDAGCGACHAFAKAGSTGQPTSNAPNLDRWLAPDAARLRLPVDVFTYRRIFYGGRGMTAFGTTLSAEDLDDLVSFVAGRPFTAPTDAATPVPPLPAPPPLVTASARAVAKWSTLARLPKRAAQGAGLFAKIGCLSCHTYLGNGARRRGAPDLSLVGNKEMTVARLRRYVARPYSFGNTLMPTYADLTAKQIASLAAFLAASHGRRER
jgi:mono/diheme cytochrome c family protein